MSAKSLKGGYLIEKTGEIYDLIEQTRVHPRVDPLTAELYVRLRTNKQGSQLRKFYVHKLVIQSFHPKSKQFVRNKIMFKDLNPGNAHIDNLYYDTKMNKKKMDADNDPIWNINSDALYC